MNNLVDIENVLINLASLTVYKNFLSDNTGLKFMILLEAIHHEEEFNQIAEYYSDFVSEIYNSEFRGDFSSAIRNFVLSDENPVSIDCAKGLGDKIPLYILGAFEFELRILSGIASITFNDIRELLLMRYPDFEDAINSLPAFDSYKLLFTKDQIQSHYKQEGCGVISRYSAFKVNSDNVIIPVKKQDEIKLEDLKLYDYQKNILKKNTVAFINGKPANNILLYGDRGCGKSSSVKAIANEFKNLGLKIVQINKENIFNLTELMEYLSCFPSKFIIFIDDLVFNDNDEEFTSAKAALEGSLTGHPKNVLIYATTNRRHLVKETFSSREGNEVHLNDTMDEAASLSDRFGITITFSSPDKKGYLEIVKKLAEEMKVEITDELYKNAEAFALLKGTRAPRIAKQFLMCHMSDNIL